MPDRMLQFASAAQQTPPKRAADPRRQDFADIYAEYAPTQTANQVAA